jgi:CRP/FNR family transcriptional regulator
VIVEGELRSVRQSAEGREQVLSTERTGAILAVAPLFNSGKFYSTMIADTPSQIACLERRHVQALCREHTELLWALAGILAERVRHYSKLIETLAFKNVEQRLCQHLLAIARERGVRLGDGCIVELKFTRAEIASRLGSTREVVSRAFAHLQRTGLIQMDGRRLVTVPDMRALGAFAGAEHWEQEPEPVSELSSDIA